MFPPKKLPSLQRFSASLSSRSPHNFLQPGPSIHHHKYHRPHLITVTLLFTTRNCGPPRQLLCSARRCAALKSGTLSPSLHAQSFPDLWPELTPSSSAYPARPTLVITKHTPFYPTQPLHLHVFLPGNPPGVDNFDTSIESVDCSDGLNKATFCAT